jgi:hypothetical protein
MKLLGGKTCEIKLSDPYMAKEMFDTLRNQGVFYGEAIKEIELL